MIMNEFVSPESTFVDLGSWDQNVHPALTPLTQDPQTPIWVGVDASTKRDSTALVACTFDKLTKCVRLVTHKVFTPTPGDPINFEVTVEATLLDWRKKFRLRRVLFDPYQMASVAQRLAKQYIRIEEYPQTIPNLTAATSNLYDLLQARQLILYPDAQMRLAISRAIIVESSRGWRLDKLKQAHKIDVVVALSMAALAAVRGQSESNYCLAEALGVYDEPAPERPYIPPLPVTWTLADFRYHARNSGRGDLAAFADNLDEHGFLNLRYEVLNSRVL
jgi:phage terminase large subunit-like protein